MPVLTFSIKDLSKVVNALNSSIDPLTPNCEDLFDPTKHFNGVILDRLGHKQSDPKFSFPDPHHIDASKLEKQLWLVKDQGIYIVANTSPKPFIAYAKGCNPATDDDFYETSLSLIGGDDCCIKIPLDWFEYAVFNNKRVFKIKITKDSISLIN